MNLPRRKFLQFAAGAAALPALPRAATAQAYPTRPVRIIVGYAPGGQVDIVARLIGQWLSERLGQPFVIENRPGATTNIATEAVVRAPADGYTLLSVGASQAISATLFNKLNFHLISDITPVAGILVMSSIMVVSPSVPATTVPEFVAYAKAHAGKLNMASSGIGSPSHVCGELFKMLTGVNMVHVPYRGAALALTDLFAGQVQVYFSPTPAAIEYVRAGKLRALAVTTAARSEALPDIATVAESVPGYEASIWQGIGAPKDTPPEIVEKLNREINAGLADAKLKARLADLGGTVLPSSPGDFGKLIADETEKWAKVIKFAGLKPD
jgi:tripartite-type tricarboxylate transporter receptor subunit TctC